MRDTAPLAIRKSNREVVKVKCPRLLSSEEPVSLNECRRCEHFRGIVFAGVACGLVVRIQRRETHG